MSSIKPNINLFRSPIRDTNAMFGNCQHNKRCRELELNVLDCTDVYGHKGLLKQCVTEYEDYLECLYHRKQIARVDAMKKERMRQYLSGERSKKDLYSPPPKLDSFHETYVKSID